MKKHIKTLINISLGLNAKAGISGEYFLVQAKDFSEDLGWNSMEMPATNGLLVRPQHVLERGDVLLLCKGKSFKAKEWDLKEKAVASSSYFVLRATTGKLLPAYLCWFLNTKKVQEYFLSQSSGTTVHSISKKTVGMLELPICSIADQKKIIESHKLWQEEKAARKALIEAKNRWVEQELFQRIQLSKQA